MPELIKEIESVVKYLYAIEVTEIIFIDDGSSDNSFNILLNIKQKNPKVKIIQFRSNFGKTIVLRKAFEYASGEYLITLDADLQDDPREIERFIQKIEEGYDLVSGWKEKRKDGWLRVLGSRLFNKVVSKLADVRLHDFNCGFKIYRKELYKLLAIHGEQHRFIPMIAKKMGYKVTEIVIHHRQRKYGKSKYPAIRFNALFDVLSIYFLYSHTKSPFRFFGMISLASLMFYLVAGVIVLNVTFISPLSGMIQESIRFLLAFSFYVLSIPLLFTCIGLIAELFIHHTFKGSERSYRLQDSIVLKILE